MNTRFQDLAYEQLSDGTIRIEQRDYCGEEVMVDLHPEQLLFIARCLCGMKQETAAQVADLERRIAVLTDKVQNIVCNKAFRSDLLEGLSDGFEHIAKLDALLDLALEFDGGRLEPEEHDEPSCHTDKAMNTQPKATAQTLAGAEQLGLEV